MLAVESSRLPGSAFVEEDGATGALAQAMLSIVFRMIRLGHERGFLRIVRPGQEREFFIAPGGRRATEPVDGCQETKKKKDHLEGEGAGMFDCFTLQGQSQSRTPWETVVEALTATVAAMATAGAEGGPVTASGEGVSSLGFAGRLVRLFCDQDDALVDMLLTNLHIFLNAKSPVGHLSPPSLGVATTVAERFFGLV